MWIGIDPDARGAIAAWDAGGLADLRALPVEPSERRALLRELVRPGVRVALESIPLITSNGHVGRHTSAVRWGALREALLTLGADVVEVAPVSWQAALGLASRGHGRAPHKARLHAAAERVCGRPVPLAHADAVLLGYWLRGLELARDRAAGVPDVRGDGCVAAGGG